MANPRIPPDIAKKIAAMKPAAPTAALAVPAARPVPAASSSPAAPKALGSWVAKLTALGWVLALLGGAAAYLEFKTVDRTVADALAQQAAGYEQQIAAIKGEGEAKVREGEARLRKATDDAAATQQSIQVELDYAKMPDLPLKTSFRPGQVLYVENESDVVFTGKVKMFRPVGAVTKEFDFTLKNRAFKDVAAVEDWVFQKGDTITFTKPGFKPRELVVP